jgi:acyl-CoA thioesterase I
MARHPKRWTIPLVLLLTVLLCATTAAAYWIDDPVPPPDATVHAEVTLQEGRPLRVAFIGDSLDFGLYASEPRSGFHQLMLDAWRATGPVVDTPLDSLGGTARNALRNDRFPMNQDVILVELGTNDFDRVDHHAFRRDYDELIARLHAASPKAALVCVGIWRPADAAQRFDTIIKDLCESRGGAFRRIGDLAEDDLLKGPSGAATFSGPSDNFHPNDRGHRAIADRMLDVIAVSRQG